MDLGFCWGLHGEWLLGLCRSVSNLILGIFDISSLWGFRVLPLYNKNMIFSFNILLDFLWSYSDGFLRFQLNFVVGSWCFVVHYYNQLFIFSDLSLSLIFILILCKNKDRCLLSTVLVVYSTDTKMLFSVAGFFSNFNG